MAPAAGCRRPRVGRRQEQPAVSVSHRRLLLTAARARVTMVTGLLREDGKSWTDDEEERIDDPIRSMINRSACCHTV